MMFERDRDTRDGPRGPDYRQAVATQLPGDDLLVMDIDNSRAWVRSDTFQEVRQ